MHISLLFSWFLFWPVFSSLVVLSEFMSKGSVYNFLHKQKGIFKLPALVKVAIDVSKGMNYLHQNNIIHRDLKTANLLMDEHEVRVFLKNYKWRFFAISMYLDQFRFSNSLTVLDANGNLDKKNSRKRIFWLC